MHHTTVVLLGTLVVSLYSGFVPAPPSPPSSTRLSVTVSCYQAADYCEAYASGGSGTGYSFMWGDATEQYDANGYSYAQPYCYPGYLVTPTASVTDSNGNSAIASASYYCFGGGGGIEP
jgi:hypothetical protein